MEAGPRDTAQGAEHVTSGSDDPGGSGDRPGDDRPRVPGPHDDGAHADAAHDTTVHDSTMYDNAVRTGGLLADGLLLEAADTGAPGAADGPREAGPPHGRPAGIPLADDRLPGDRLADDGPDDTTGGVTADGPAPEEMYPSGPEVEVELRPQRRLRIWQLAPIVALAAVGSLMFAFPLAFDFGDSGAVIAMLGLLICSCAAGWGMMAARRVGYTWPGLPSRGSGRRPDWRVVLGYVLLVIVVVVLAVWRVARLR